MYTLTIEKQARVFIPIQDFRTQAQLPPDFGMALFQAKDYSDLGSIENASAELHSLHQAIIAAIPTAVPPEGWMSFSLSLQLLFRQELLKANTAIRLRESEIDFAAAAFAEVCQACIYSAFTARMQGAPLPQFEKVYGEWLNRSIEISQVSWEYEHQGHKWQVQLVRHIFGRIGLIVHTDETIHYVHDAQIACPAEGFMNNLLKVVCQRIYSAMT